MLPLLCSVLVPMLGRGVQVKSTSSTLKKHARDAIDPSTDAAVSKALASELVRATAESSRAVSRGQTSDTRATDEHSNDEGNVLDVGDSLHHEAYTIHCRAHHLPTGTWGDCPVPEGQSASLFWQTPRMLHSSRSVNVLKGQNQTAQGTLTKLLPQVCVDAANKGKWEMSSSAFPRDSLGSHSRYAGKQFYLGPPSALKDLDKAVFARPHAMANTELSRPLELESTPEFLWTPESSGTSCPEFGWMRQGEAHACLAGTWIAVWGDSTSRILFSALLDFLGGGIESEALPTHDFTYKRHWELHDHCFQGTQCHLAVHIPNHNILLTFNFVTKLAEWPDLNKTLGHYVDNHSFPDITWPRSRPDIVLANSGPWELYGRQKVNSETDSVHAHLLREFMNKNFPPGDPTKLLLLRNSACPQDGQDAGTCEWSSMPCMEAMDHFHDIQSEVVKTFDSSQVRYIDGAYAKIVPEGYQCKGETSYHLPSVITDMKLNHALHTLCRA
eukprot:TRINITY_DN3444_c0_g1_i3.p1 TRINITY_DN3444_c0_g1~~TRINITY_DN3444_c0_g1_i3.p1  ORF type:complete len:499 (+),score=27.40 TRINITY_DN3444_c0_g1_i3:73-1569(+)